MTDFVTPTLLVPAMRRDISMRALETQFARVHVFDLSKIVVGDIDSVAASALPFIAMQYGLYGDIEWSLAQTEQQKRALLKVAMKLNRKRGSAWALKEVFRLLGMGEVTIQQGRAGIRRGAGVRRGDGFHARGNARYQWSAYRVICPVLLSIEQIKVAIRLADNWAPARCHLHSFVIQSDARLIRNGFARRNGSYTRGAYYL